jgi:hypothetical protein
VQGDVYFKYADVASAGRAQVALNGRLFDGRSIAVEYIPESTYLAKFPAASGAVTQLKPNFG